MSVALLVVVYDFITFVASFLENVLLIALIWQCRTLHIPRNFFLVGITLCDLLCSIHATYNNVTYLIDKKQAPVPHYACITYTFSLFFSSLYINITILTLNLTIYLLYSRPFLYARINTVKVTILLHLFIIFVSLVSAGIFIGKTLRLRLSYNSHISCAYRVLKAFKTNSVDAVILLIITLICGSVGLIFYEQRVYYKKLLPTVSFFRKKQKERKHIQMVILLSGLNYIIFKAPLALFLLFDRLSDANTFALIFLYAQTTRVTFPIIFGFLNIRIQNEAKRISLIFKTKCIRIINKISKTNNPISTCL